HHGTVGGGDGHVVNIVGAAFSQAKIIDDGRGCNGRDEAAHKKAQGEVHGGESVVEHTETEERPTTVVVNVTHETCRNKFTANFHSVMDGSAALEGHETEAQRLGLRKFRVVSQRGGAAFGK
ncbi:hypothetical protein FOZ62_014560, partial [Perkinsus olseni]